MNLRYSLFEFSLLTMAGSVFSLCELGSNISIIFFILKNKIRKIQIDFLLCFIALTIQIFIKLDPCCKSTYHHALLRKMYYCMNFDKLIKES